MLKNYEEFHIIGHSFGGLLAIQLASELEKSGRKGRVTVIDGSVAMFRDIISSRGIDQTEEQLQDYVLSYLVSISYQNVDRSKFTYLLDEKTWEAKCNKTIDLVLEKGHQYSREDLKHCFNACYNRTRIMRNGDKLGFVKHSKCLFIRPSERTFEHEKETYELEDNFEEKIEVAQFEGNHQTILSNPKMAEIINIINDK